MRNKFYTFQGVAQNMQLPDEHATRFACSAANAALASPSFFDSNPLFHWNLFAVTLGVLGWPPDALHMAFKPVLTLTAGHAIWRQRFTPHGTQCLYFHDLFVIARAPPASSGITAVRCVKQQPL
jgi:hypothetical protein